MNELYAVDPEIIKTSHELKHLLSFFGPFTGQYLAIYQKNWVEQVEGYFKELLDREEIGDVEFKRVLSLLREAREHHSIIHCQEIERCGRTWLENVAELLRRDPPVFSDIVASDASPPAKNSLDEFEPPRNAAEYFLSKPQEYVRICRTLIFISREIAIVDPFIDLTNNNNTEVLSGLFFLAAKSKVCERISIWTGLSMLNGNRDKVSGNYDLIKTKKDFQSKLHDLANKSNLKNCLLEVNFVNHHGDHDTFHSRCIISIKGGIKIDQGFKILGNGRQSNQALPIGENLHNELCQMYFEGKHDMSIDSNPIKIIV